MNHIEKATTFFAGLNRQDPVLATRYVTRSTTSSTTRMSATAQMACGNTSRRSHPSSPTFLASRGTHLAKPCAYVDLYRVENGNIVEHWGFPTPIPEPHAQRHGNGFF